MRLIYVFFIIVIIIVHYFYHCFIITLDNTVASITIIFIIHIDSLD